MEIPVFNNDKVEINFQEIISEQCPHLSGVQQQQLCDVLHKHRDVFNDRPELSNIMPFSINVDETKVLPKRCMFPVPMCYRSEVDLQIEEMLRERIIEPCRSAYPHPIVCLRKKDNSVRIAIDFSQGTNKILKVDRFVMPN